jgi:hypothetical protein
MGPRLDLLWQEYVIAGPEVRQEIERVLRIELACRLNETFESTGILLKPPLAQVSAGACSAGLTQSRRRTTVLLSTDAMGLAQRKSAREIGAEIC